MIGELDKQDKAEYFLIGSLASTLWAVAMTALIALFDRDWGVGLLPSLVALLGDAEAS